MYFKKVKLGNSTENQNHLPVPLFSSLKTEMKNEYIRTK